MSSAVAPPTKARRPTGEAAGMTSLQLAHGGHGLGRDGVGTARSGGRDRRPGSSPSSPRRRSRGDRAPPEPRRRRARPPRPCRPRRRCAPGSVVCPGNSRFRSRKPCFDSKPGKRADARGAAVEREHGHGGREQEADGGDEADDRPRMTAATIGPEAALGRIARRPKYGMRSARSRRPEAEHGREERQRRDDRDDADEDRARRQAAHDRVRHELEAGHRENERSAAEEHGAARRGPRRLDRVELLAPLGALLAEPAEDEERVVDPERESHPEDHVRDEDGEIEHLAEQRRQRRAPRRWRERPGRAGSRRRPRSEDEQEDDQGGRRAEEELALP